MRQEARGKKQEARAMFDAVSFVSGLPRIFYTEKLIEKHDARGKEEQARRGKKQEARVMRQEARSTSSAQPVSFVFGLARNFEKEKLRKEKARGQKHEARGEGDEARRGTRRGGKRQEARSKKHEQCSTQSVSFLACQETIDYFIKKN